MTNIAAAVRQTPEQAFAEWAWETVSRLHLMDRGGAEARGAAASDRDVLAALLDYDLDQRLQKVSSGLLLLI